DRAGGVQVLRHRAGELLARKLPRLRLTTRSVRPADEAAPPLHHPLRVLQPLAGEVRVAPVVRLDELEPDRGRVEALVRQVADRVEVALALRHLLALDHEVARVRPLAREALRAPRAPALRDLALVMGEDVVLAAGVQVDRVIEG